MFIFAPCEFAYKNFIFADKIHNLGMHMLLRVDFFCNKRFSLQENKNNSDNNNNSNNEQNKSESRTKKNP